MPCLGSRRSFWSSKVIFFLSEYLPTFVVVATTSATAVERSSGSTIVPFTSAFDVPKFAAITYAWKIFGVSTQREQLIEIQG